MTGQQHCFQTGADHVRRSSRGSMQHAFTAVVPANVTLGQCPRVGERTCAAGIADGAQPVCEPRKKARKRM